MAGACHVPATAVPGAREKRVGEHEWDIGMLTVLSNWTEEGRRGKIDERGQSSGEWQWRPGSAGPIPAEFGRGRAREWVEEAKGEAREALAQGIKAGWRATAGAASGGTALLGPSRALLSARERR